jgi:ADP-ribose pyrophosphatase YjhB (NUDIX family)
MKALAQTGINFKNSEYDLERYREMVSLVDEMLAGITDWPLEKIKIHHKGDVSYITPKVDVRVLIFDGDKLLLIKERADGLWALPGGWADIGFSPSQVAVKEVKEETGLDVRIDRLLAVFDNHSRAHGHPPSPFHVYKLFFSSEVTGGDIFNHGHEALDIGYFPLTNLPPLSEERNTISQIFRLFEAAKSKAFVGPFYD